MLGLELVHANGVSVDFRCHGGATALNSGVAVALCGRVVAVRLEGLLEALDSPSETSSRATHQDEARTPVQPLREVAVTMLDAAGRRSTLSEGLPQRNELRSRRAALGAL
jgi:hypothetical protein